MEKAIDGLNICFDIITALQVYECFRLGVCSQNEFSLYLKARLELLILKQLREIGQFPTAKQV